MKRLLLTAALITLSALAWPDGIWAESAGQILDRADRAFWEDRLDLAEVALERAVALGAPSLSRKKEIKLLMRLVLVRGRLGRFDQGRADFEQAWRLGLKVHAEPPIFGADRAAMLIYKAAKVRMQGQWDESDRLARQAGEIIPDHPQPDFVLAVNAFERKNYDLAEQYVLSALKKDILFGYAWNVLAKIKYFQGWYAEAAYYYPMTIRLYPDSKYQNLWRERLRESRRRLPGS